MEFDKDQDFEENNVVESHGGHLSDIVDYDAKWEELVGGIMGYNKFLTEINHGEDKFVNKFNIFNCLGYEDSEFTVKAMNNDKHSPLHLIFEEDLEHKIRYDKISFGTVGPRFRFKSLRDYYKLSFRVKHKNGDLLKVERSCYLFRLDENGAPLSHLVLWEVSQNPSPFVELSYYSPHYKSMIKNFYEENCIMLGLKFTPKEKEILEYKNRQYTNKEIQGLLNSSSIRTVEKHIENIMKKMKISFLERGQNIQINSIREVLYYSKKFGLYPFY